MQYEKMFDPGRHNPRGSDSAELLVDFRGPGEQSSLTTDRRDGLLYYYDDEIVLRINVALATGRPLLVRGPSGCGKSSLAFNVARVMGRRYYEKVITARDQARDLLWRFDAVKRLGDAQTASAAGPPIRGVTRHRGRRAPFTPGRRTAHFESHYPYVEPEVLWWVFDRASAERRGLPRGQDLFYPPAADPVMYEPPQRTPRRTDPSCVVLIDEIDKADPDVPNDLLVPLGSLAFTVDETDRRVMFGGEDAVASDRPALPLVIITSNDERRLPPAFLRRCVQLQIAEPSRERLIRIAEASEGGGAERKGVYERVLEAVEQFHDQRTPRPENAGGAPCSIAEFLDAVRACLRLDPRGDAGILPSIVEATTWKRALGREGPL